MLEVKEMDLVVIGGGLSGVCAAVAGARKGLKTALVHDRPVPGGNCSSEIAINMNGAAQNGHSPSLYAREGGIVEEFKQNYRYYGKDRDLGFFSMVNNQENLEVYLNTYITDADCADGKSFRFRVCSLPPSAHLNLSRRFLLAARAMAVLLLKREPNICTAERHSLSSAKA